MEPESSTTKSILSVPIAIVLAGALIAGAVFLSRDDGSAEKRAETETPENIPPVTTPQKMDTRPITEKDHIKGNPNATILIVEYSDTECPFCKNFHRTMETIIDEYGKSGKVAWVYRHFPLLQLHPKAPKEAEALECAAELGGNSSFWEYITDLFRVTPSNNGLDLGELPNIAEWVGLEKEAFQTCLDSSEKLPIVQADLNEAVGAGGNGTPFNIFILKQTLSQGDQNRLMAINQELLRQLPQGSPDPIVISSDKQKVSIGGAFQYPLMKEIIDLLLTK